MGTLATTFTAWSGLPDIDDVEPLGEADQSCIDEIRAVLARHDALDRFGLTLLHSHFELAEGEILVESVDTVARRLETRVVRAEDPVAEAAIETSWRLDDISANVKCETMCLRPEGPRGPHAKTHYENHNS